MQPTLSNPTPVAGAIAPSLSRWFYPTMAALAIAIVGLGFAPTFYLRALGTESLPPNLQVLPGYFYVHGVILTTWFLLFFAQTLLVASNRKEIHRRVGVAGAAVATAVVIMTLVVTVRAIKSPLSVSVLDLPVVFFFNAFAVIQFGVLVVCALKFRRQPAVHKRLMYLANLPLLGAATSRLLLLFPFGGFLGPNAPLLWLLALVALDFAVDGRLHRATLWGGIVFLVAPIPIIAVFGFSDFGRMIVEALA
jgi:hypothetical protein